MGQWWLCPSPQGSCSGPGDMGYSDPGPWRPVRIPSFLQRFGIVKRKLAVGYGPFRNRAAHLVLLHILSEPLKKKTLKRSGVLLLSLIQCPACQKHVGERSVGPPAGRGTVSLPAYLGDSNPSCQPCTLLLVWKVCSHLLKKLVV